jgi:hypothetical protein
MLFAAATGASAQTAHAAAAPQSTDDLLEPDVAFKASATLVGRDKIEVRYETAPATTCIATACNSRWSRPPRG